jgi:hypothetical protein
LQAASFRAHRWHQGQAFASSISLKDAVILERMDELKKTGLSLALVYGVHYVSTQFYGNVCVPSGFQGILSGIFTTASPWCHIILNTMQLTETSYGTMILTGVTRLVVGSITDTKNTQTKVE